MQAEVVSKMVDEQCVADALKRVWGFETLRPLQGQVVEAALNGRDAVVVMPTGGGKSLCYQLPAIVTNRLTVVVSPLIALMKDQVDALTVVGVSAAVLNSSQSETEADRVRQQLVGGSLRLLYVSPERLLQASTLQMLAEADRGQGVARFAIDEAHCISGWGHDFRPEYRQLHRIKAVFPGIPVQAFTATATPQVQRDIAIQLGLERPRKFVGIFDRPNLTYRVVAKDDPVRRTVEAVRRYPDEGVIVYCLSRKDTESITAALVAQGIGAVAYHAGLATETRKKVSEAFAQERANVVVATVAFGMGIDRANVRCVIHECLPKSIEGYQQETGRAGRDGLPSECVLLYNHGDVVRLKRLMMDEDQEMNAHRTKLLEEVRKFATSHVCRHKSLSEHFGQAYELDAEGCGACDVCLGGTQALADSSAIGHKLIRAVAELCSRPSSRSFGVGFLVSVLTGARLKLVLERRADGAACFGQFNNQGAERLNSWLHQLLDLGLLTVSEGAYPLISVTQSGLDSLESQSEINLVENITMLAPAKARSGKGSAEIPENVDPVLFDRLRAWRREIATQREVPAYVVFHDSTLMKIAASRPSQLEALRAIPGFGERRVEEYGEALIEIVRQYCEETGAASDQNLLTLPASNAGLGGSKSLSAGTAEQYAVFFRAGRSIEDTAAELRVRPSTVGGHLATWVLETRPTDISAWVDKETHAKVAAALDQEPSGLLKPVFEVLGETVPYDVIRLVKTFIGTEPAG